MPNFRTLAPCFAVAGIFPGAPNFSVWGWASSDPNPNLVIDGASNFGPWTRPMTPAERRCRLAAGILALGGAPEPAR